MQPPDVRHDDPMTATLHRALGNCTGMLRVSNAFLLCGLEARNVTQDQIKRFGRAIRALGWERKRCRRAGMVEYVYVRGNEIERKIELLVVYDPHTQTARIGHATN